MAYCKSTIMQISPSRLFIPGENSNDNSEHPEFFPGGQTSRSELCTHYSPHTTDEETEA